MEKGECVGSTEHEMIWAIWLTAGKIFGIKKKKSRMFACAKKAWPLLLRGVYKLVQQFNKVSVMQYLMPGKKKQPKTTFYTYYLWTAESLQIQQGICSTLLELQTQHQEELFFPPHFCRGCLPSPGFVQDCHSQLVLSGTGQNESETKYSPHSFQSGTDKLANWISLQSLRSTSDGIPYNNTLEKQCSLQ